MFEEKGFEQSLWSPKHGCFERADRLGEVDKAAIGGEVEQSQSAGGPQSSFFGYARALPLVNQQQVGAERFREGDCGGFSLVETGRLRQARSVVDFQPWGRGGNPQAHRWRREGMGEFGFGGGGESDSFEDARQQADVADLNEIVNGTGIGDHQPHGSDAQFFEGLAFLLEVFERVVLIDAVGFEEAIELDAGEAQHLAQLQFGDAAGAEFFEGEGFEGSAFQLFVDGFAAEVGGQFVGELEG